jgi:hypothetical protein
MPLREFVDANGIHWTVWSTIPAWRSTVPAEMQTGWLTFESAAGRRRLAPIPGDWELADADELCQFCERSEVVRQA